jgi:ketosteroid isomerase-like protein
MPISTLAQFIEQYHRSVDTFVKGDPEPQKRLWSRRDDITLANPLGPPVRGWHQVEMALDHAASLVQDGEVLGSERIAEVETADLAYIVEIEQARVQMGGAAAFAPVSLRVTSIFRREENAWQIVHRHADPVTTAQPIESIVER